MPNLITTIEGTIPDFLLGAGSRPTVEVTREYLSGGGSGFPLMQQVVLARGGDDLSRDFGIEIYEAMLNDSTVASGVGMLISGILAGDLQFLPSIKPEEGEEIPPGSDRALELEESEDAAKFCNRSFKGLKLPIGAVSWDLLQGMAFGCKIAEKVYRLGDGDDAGRLVLDVIRPKRRQSWDFVVAPSGEVVAIRGVTYDAGLVDLPPEKFVIFTWMPRDGDPRGRSILRGAYNGWNLKLNAWPKYYDYLEHFGSPFIVGTAAEGAPDEPAYDDDGKLIPNAPMLTPTEAMAQMLARLKGSSYAAVRAGSTVEVFQSAGEGQAFQHAFDLFKHEILEGILLSARALMEAKRSSKADADQAQDTVGQLIRYGRETLEGCYRLVCHQLLELNHGKNFADRNCPHPSLGRGEQQDFASQLTAYTTAGFAVDPSQFPAIDARLGLPTRAKPEPGEVDANGDPIDTPGESDDDATEFSDGGGRQGAVPFAFSDPDVSLADIQTARRFWEANAPKPFKGLIDATEEDAESGLDAGTVATFAWPKFTWDAKARQYRDSNGRFVPRADVLGALTEVIVASQDDMRKASESLASGSIDLATWERSMRVAVKTILVCSAAIAAGGWARLTPAQIGAAGVKVREQYGFLDGFARAIDSGQQPLDGKFIARAVSYATAAHSLYEVLLRRGDLATGRVLRERRFLGSGESCASCIRYAGMGWQSPGVLPDIGSSCECGSFCRCRFAREMATSKG